jgi:glycosyltransferase involved in cell wall biosynthesis
VSRSGLRPLVSVLTPSFNQGRFLGDCIESVTRQTYPEVEHVVFDGGSTDESLDVLGRAPGTVRWCSEPDTGQANAVNKALRSSRGAILGWLNSDDAYLDPHAIEAAVDVFARKPEVDVVYGHAALVAADGELLHTIWVPPFTDWLHRRVNFVIQPAAFVRRSAVGETLLDESYDFTMDRELWLRLRSEGHGFARVGRILAIDRHHPARKVYTMQDVGDRERDRLRVAYDLPDWRGQTRPSALYRVVARMLGVGLVGAATRPAAFDVRHAKRSTLLRRQVATRRRSMPARDAAGGGSPDDHVRRPDSP